MKDPYDSAVRVVRLCHSSTCATVGAIDLIEKYYNNPKGKIIETHSWLNCEYRNKGFGALLYAKAIQWGLSRGYRVRSSDGPSSDACRVWEGKKIRKYHRIRTFTRADGGVHFLAYQKEKSRAKRKR
jgi:GNAT superfamily N-acetyltransferase